MPDGASNSDLGPIDYTAIDRLGSRIRWREDPSAKTLALEHPFSTDLTPRVSLETRELILSMIMKIY